MTQDEVIARRYAKGLVEHAVETGVMAEVRHDIGLVAGLMDPKAVDTYVPELTTFLDAPTAATGEKQKAVAAMLEKAGVGKTMIDFLGVLIERGRVRLMPKIAQAFGGVAAGITGEHTAVVQTARALTQDQLERLRAVLSAMCGGTVHIEQRVEPGLLAGAKVTLGDRTFDGSVHGKLETMRRHLISGGVFNPESGAAAAN